MKRDTMSGLDYMRKIAAGEIEAAPMARLLNIRITAVEEGHVTVTGEPAREFENGLQIAHGGFAAALLDTALGCAVNSVMPAGKIFTTLEMKINFTHAVTRNTGTLTCAADVVHAGRTTATAEGRIVDDAGKLYAHGTATCILFRDTTESASVLGPRSSAAPAPARVGGTEDRGPRTEDTEQEKSS